MTIVNIESGEKNFLLSALAWQYEMGIDDLIAPECMNYEQYKIFKPVVKKSAPQSYIGQEILPDSLEALYQKRSDLKSALSKTARHTVLPRGSEKQNPIMIIGDTPDEFEDQTGVAYCHKKGLLLERMTASIGIALADCHLTHFIPWRPPGSRDPNAQEIAENLPFLNQEIKIVDPSLILVMGGVTARALLNETASIQKLEGKQFDYLQKPVLVLHSLQSLMSTPLYKAQAWKRLLALKEYLKSTDQN